MSVGDANPAAFNPACVLVESGKSVNRLAASPSNS
jgi:hypothetical protein